VHIPLEGKCMVDISPSHCHFISSWCTLPSLYHVVPHHCVVSSCHSVIHYCHVVIVLSWWYLSWWYPSSSCCGGVKSLVIVVLGHPSHVTNRPTSLTRGEGLQALSTHVGWGWIEVERGDETEAITYVTYDETLLPSNDNGHILYQEEQ